MSERLPGIRPRPSLWGRLDGLARQSFAGATTGLMLLAVAAPFGLAGQAELLVAIALACVFFWSLFRPGCMPPPLVFGLGVLADLLGYAPLGVDVLILLIAHGLALRWRRFLIRQGFFVVWLAFVLVAAGGAALQWALTCILMLRFLPPLPVLFQAALAAGLYPLLAVLLTRAHHSLGEAVAR
jgi:rod shape-determining protein MreD